MAKVIDFPEFAPDLTSLGTNVSGLISGAVPQVDGYGPFKSLVEFTLALPAASRGYKFARLTDGSIAVFAGTATRLYKLDNTTFNWTDVSKGGSAYSSLVVGNNWQFGQFNNLFIAVQVNTVPQKFNLASSVAFEDLLGSPPQAADIAIINQFIVLTGLLTEKRRVQWCDLEAPETWTAGVGLADYQDLPDGGSVLGVAGGDRFGAVFQDEPVRTLTYNPGSPTTFNIARISQNDPLYAKYSILNSNDKIYFLSAQGFKVIDPGGAPRAIGKGRVDEFFFGDVDSASTQLIIGAADPTSTRVYWAYKSLAGSAGLFDKVLCYDPAIGQNGRWSLLPLRGQYIAALAKPGVTLEQLDAIAPTPLTVSGAANNGAGLIRLTLNATSNADFAIAGQNFIVVQGVVGTTEANGRWVATIIDATHIDLVGSTFTNAYVSGGKIGGSLDALPFSLDSISVASIAALSAFSEDSKVGFFNGDNIEAILETAEQDLEGNLVFIQNTVPMTDAAAALVSIAGRMTAQATAAYTAESAINALGEAPLLLETRYAKARLRVPAGATWSYARGVRPVVELAGDR